MPSFNLNDYVTVDERIDRFWSDYPHGAIRTEMVYANNDGSSVAIKASVYKDWEHPQPDATGIAQELQGGANANKSSWWENCETSAIGRALANMGMSISKQRPSREEMAKVQRYQDEADAPRPTPPSNGTPAPASAPPAANTIRIPCEKCLSASTCRTEGYCQIAAVAQERYHREKAASKPAAPANWTTVWAEAKSRGYNTRADLDALMAPDKIDDRELWKVLARLKEAAAPAAPPPSH